MDYRFTTAYDPAFPKLSDWVVFADYDGDGREDLFTYSKGWAGIMVYRNVSELGNPAFQQVAYPYLTSLQGGGEVNILATNADYPALTDLDGDGDLDLLTFGVMGTFIEHHQNMSVERYGCRDSLVFERVDLCWGRVGESEEDNVMYLDTCLFGYGLRVDPVRHRGATVAVRDLNGDALPDLLLADVDYPDLTLLVNGGDPQQALMVSQTEEFPPQHPVRLPSMPVPFFTDVNNDGVDDLIVSPFDPDPMACRGLQSVWLYLNHGTNQHPDFQLYTKSFLQETMIDLGTGAYPVMTDWDADGLLDLVVGTIGNLDGASRWSLFRNVGTEAHPVFAMDHVASLPQGVGDSMGLVPTFADLDQDGRQECVVGSSEGRLLLLDDDLTVLDDDFLHYGRSWSVPCAFDADGDGLVDLVVGNASGKLSFYQGLDQGETIRFEFVTDFWGEVDVRDYQSSYFGYSAPTLFKYKEKTLLCVGSECGRLFLFEVAGKDAFDEVSYLWEEICAAMPFTFGLRSSAALADLDGDGLLEVLVGNFGGGLRLFNAEIPVHFGVEEEEEYPIIMIFPNPVQSQLRIVSSLEGLRYAIVTDVYGRRCMERIMHGKEGVMEVSALPPGVYVLGLAFDFGLVNRIFLKR